MEDIRMLNTAGNRAVVGKQVRRNRTVEEQPRNNMMGKQLTREQIVARKKMAKFIYRAKVIAVFLAAAIAVSTAVLLINIANAHRAEERENMGFYEPVMNEMAEIAVPQIEADIIRCSVSCTEGYTRSGEYTHEGVIGGKFEWLGRECNLYALDEDGSIGEKIGSYEFLDTGYGIDGSMEKGESVTVWVPNMEACWKWIDTYGDYVYIEFVD